MFSGLRKYRRIEEISNSPVYTLFSPYPQTPPLLSNYNVDIRENHGPSPRSLPRPPFNNNFWIAPRNGPVPFECLPYQKRGGS